MVHRYRQSVKAFLAVAALLLGSGGVVFERSAWADDVAFSGGSLIIPMQANFQDACGVTSAYGLVWQILRANQPGHYFANADHLVTVYLVTNGNKKSHNRCIPSNRTPAPSPSNPGPSGDLNHWDDPKWNDGCDFTVTSATQQPVVPVDFSANPAWPDSGQFPFGTIPFINTFNLKITGTGWDNNWNFASPGLPATTLDNTVTSPSFTTVQYQGAPFIVDSADAPYVLQFLRDGDSFTSASYLRRFTSTTDPVSGLTSCSASSNGTVPSQDYHHVNVHQATERFTAPILRRLNRVPPKVALLDEGAGVKWVGYEPNLVAPNNRVLDMYLKNANLFFPGAAGCPPDTFSGCTLNGGNPEKSMISSALTPT